VLPVGCGARALDCGCCCAKGDWLANGEFEDVWAKGDGANGEFCGPGGGVFFANGLVLVGWALSGVGAVD
jgi:hypothetical protein